MGEAVLRFFRIAGLYCGQARLIWGDVPFKSLKQIPEISFAFFALRRKSSDS